MPSDRIKQSLNDILDAISKIRSWIDQAGGIDAAVHHNELVRAAVERKLLIVSEAAIRIDHADKTFAPLNAPEIDWRNVRGIGNILRHRYDDLDTETLLGVPRNRLDPLEAACQRLLAQP